MFLVVGNHDMPQVVSRATTLDIFRTMDVRDVYTADALSAHVIPTASGPVQIVALPWIVRLAR